MATAPSSIFRLPDLGEGLQEAEVVAWHVAEGDHIVADQPLVSVETDKAVVEIPSPRAGRVAHLLAGLHERLPVGAPLLSFAEETGADTGTVVGDLAAPAPAAAPASPPARAPVSGAVRPHVAPAIRALAANRGVDLTALAGTGPGGEITRRDVERAAGAPTGAEPLAGVRRAMAQRMEQTRGVVAATVTDEADIGAWPPDADLTTRLVRALVAGCQAEPALNAAFLAQTMTWQLNAAVHVGLAVDTDDGLIVPVLRDAGTLTPTDLRAAVDRLTEAARARRMPPDALRGATISLSNFGALGGRFAALVVVPPQVAILGAGRAHTYPVLRDGTLATTRLLPLSLTFDHRVVSGGEAARFLNAVKASLEAVT